MKFGWQIFRVILLLTLASCIRAQGPLIAPALSSEDAARLQAAIVSLSCENVGGKSPTQGRGFFVGDNFVATDYQVVKDASRIQVKRADGKRKEARLIAVDSRWAVALLFVDDAKAEPLLFGDSESLFVTPQLFVFDQNALQSVSASAESFSLNERRYRRLSLSVAPEQRGHPIFNAAGEVIGLAVAAPRAGEVVSAAIPASYVISLGQFAIAGGIRGAGNKGVEEAMPERPSGALRGEIVVASGSLATRGAESALIRQSGSTLQGQAIRKVIPLYPPRARDSLIVGLVVVELVINEEGEVIWVKVVSGNRLLKDAATAAARGWKFKAAKVSGKPVRVVGRITFNFVS